MDMSVDQRVARTVWAHANGRAVARACLGVQLVHVVISSIALRAVALAWPDLEASNTVWFPCYILVAIISLLAALFRSSVCTNLETCQLASDDGWIAPAGSWMEGAIRADIALANELALRPAPNQRCFEFAHHGMAQLVGLGVVLIVRNELPRGYIAVLAAAVCLGMIDAIAAMLDLVGALEESVADSSYSRPSRATCCALLAALLVPGVNSGSVCVALVAFNGGLTLRSGALTCSALALVAALFRLREQKRLGSPSALACACVAACFLAVGLSFTAVNERDLALPATLVASSCLFYEPLRCIAVCVRYLAAEPNMTS